MLRIFFILLSVGLIFWGLIFVTFFQADGRSFRSYLFGRFERPEPRMNIWLFVPGSQEREEQRFIKASTWLGFRSVIIRQRRRRNEVGAIIKIYPEEVYRPESS